MPASHLDFRKLRHEMQRSILRHLDFLFKVNLRCVCMVFSKWPACEFYLNGRLTRVSLGCSKDPVIDVYGICIYMTRKVIDGRWLDKVRFLLKYDRRQAPVSGFLAAHIHRCHDRLGWTKCRKSCAAAMQCRSCRKVQACSCCGSPRAGDPYTKFTIEGLDYESQLRLLRRLNAALPAAPVRLQHYWYQEKWPITYQRLPAILRRELFFAAEHEIPVSLIHRDILGALSPLEYGKPSWTGGGRKEADWNAEELMAEVVLKQIEAWNKLDLQNHSFSDIYSLFAAVSEQLSEYPFFALGLRTRYPEKWWQALRTMRKLINDLIFSHPPEPERCRVILVYAEVDPQPIEDKRERHLLQKMLQKLGGELKDRPAESRNCQIFRIDPGRCRTRKRCGIYLFLVQNGGLNARHTLAAHRQLIANLYSGECWEPMCIPKGVPRLKWDGLHLS